MFPRVREYRLKEDARHTIMEQSGKLSRQQKIMTVLKKQKVEYETDCMVAVGKQFQERDQFSIDTILEAVDRYHLYRWVFWRNKCKIYTKWGKLAHFFLQYGFLQGSNRERSGWSSQHGTQRGFDYTQIDWAEIKNSGNFWGANDWSQSV